MTGLAQPATAALDAPNDLLWIKLNHRAIRLDRIVRSLSHLLCRALLLELALGFTQSGATPLRGAQLVGQLIATGLPVKLILFAIDPIGLRQDLPRDPLIVTIRVIRSVRVNLGPVDRDHPDLHHPRFATQPEHFAEQPRDRRLMPLAKVSDRRMIRHQIRRDHPIGHILLTLPLDPARRPVPSRV